MTDEREEPEEQRAGERRKASGRRQSDRDLAAMVRLVIGVGAICVLCTVINLTISVTTSLNRRDVVDTQQLVREVQDERARATLASCIEQNSQHDDAIKRYDSRAVQQVTGKPILALAQVSLAEAEEQFERAIVRLPKAGREQSRFGHDFVVDLIDGLRPKRNCSKLVQRNVRAGDDDHG